MKKNNIKQFIPERYNPTPEMGLSDVQIAERIENKLTNTVNKNYSKSYLNIFTNNVCTFFNLLGLIVFIALLAINATISNFFFVIFYIANISIGIIQEIRAKHCIDKLSLLSSKCTKVIRNGETVEITPEQIVLDDVLYLGTGNQIPTDCTVMLGEIEVNESLLTGESVPVKKNVGDLLLAGSFITSGVCTAQATKVGSENYVQTLSAKAKEYKKPQSEIMNSLKLIIKVISFIIVPLAVAFMIKSAVINKTGIPEAVLRTSTVVIGMIPAGMFLLTSVALAVGIIKLARHNTLVQDLYSLEMLARVDTICFDKTGTITDGKMTVTSVINLQDTNDDYSNVISSMLAVLKDNNQTAIALLNKFGEQQYYNSTAILPFNSTRKLSAVTFENIGTYTYGAPEFVLSKAEYQKIKDKIEDYAKQGLRVLLLAHSDNAINNDVVPTDFSPISLILIADNVREDAIQTIKWFKENGVAIKVISGDNPITVSEVSKRVGIDGADKFISLEGLSDEEVIKSANLYTVFGRVTPEQKALLIKSLKEEGHVTAMTGDGVNDILALKEANCAISVAAGSDAARNVSHLVLMDNNFNSMPKVVYEGRRVINNVQSSASLFLMKTLFTMFVGIITLCLPYMEKYPFQLPQMIMIEVLVIGLPAFFLSFQPNDSRVQGRFISYVISKSLPSAVLMVLSVIIVEIFKQSIGLFDEAVYTTMSVCSMTLAGTVSLLFTCKPFNKYRAIMFSASLLAILSVILFALTSGLGMLGLVKMIPFGIYWHHLLIVILIVMLDFPLLSLLQKLFAKIKLPDFTKKRS